MDRLDSSDPIDFSEHTVLIVDDDRMMRRYLEAQLANLGCRFESAGNAEEALEAIARRTPDLILMDIVMPGMDGFDLCRRLKDDPATAPIGIIHLTSLGRDAKDRSFAAGADDFLNKPPHFVELRSRMRTHLHIRSLQRSLESVGPEPAIPLEPGRPARILVVESHPTLREHMVAALGEAGHEVRAVEGLQACLPLLGTGRVDLLILDHHPADGNGHEFAVQLRSHRRTAHLPTLLVCARQNLEQELGPDAALGPWDYLTKPFQPGELRVRVAVLLRQLSLARGEQAGGQGMEALVDPATGLFTGAFLSASLGLRVERGIPDFALLGIRLKVVGEGWEAQKLAFEAAVAGLKLQRRLGELLARVGEATFLFLLPDTTEAEAAARGRDWLDAGGQGRFCAAQWVPGETPSGVLKRLSAGLV